MRAVPSRSLSLWSVPTVINRISNVLMINFTCSVYVLPAHRKKAEGLPRLKACVSASTSRVNDESDPCPTAMEPWPRRCSSSRLSEHTYCLRIKHNLRLQTPTIRNTNPCVARLLLHLFQVLSLLQSRYHRFWDQISNPHFCVLFLTRKTRNGGSPTPCVGLL